MGRRSRYEPGDRYGERPAFPLGTADRERRVHEMDQRLIAIQRVLDRTGSADLARELRQARTAISDLLDRRG